MALTRTLSLTLPVMRIITLTLTLTLALTQVVVLSARLDGPKLGPAGHERLESIPLGGFRSGEWRAPFARQVERSLRAPTRDGGAGLSDGQMKIVKDCLKSLASSRE